MGSTFQNQRKSQNTRIFSPLGTCIYTLVLVIFLSLVHLPKQKICCVFRGIRVEYLYSAIHNTQLPNPIGNLGCAYLSMFFWIFRWILLILFDLNCFFLFYVDFARFWALFEGFRIGNSLPPFWGSIEEVSRKSLSSIVRNKNAIEEVRKHKGKHGFSLNSRVLQFLLWYLHFAH